MASEVVVVKEGFLKCPQFGKDISFQKVSEECAVEHYVSRTSVSPK